jgi:hypothetical protein
VDVETTGVVTIALALHEATGITNCGSLGTEYPKGCALER